jgi:RNA-binding protein Musashi
MPSWSRSTSSTGKSYCLNPITGLHVQIDPKRAIPRDEQDKTSKIFVGGIGQDVVEEEFKEYFEQFGTVLDATLMMDKETG